MKREGERGLPEIWRWVQLKEEKGQPGKREKQRKAREERPQRHAKQFLQLHYYMNRKLIPIELIGDTNAQTV
jgi:hypothetical protein